MTRKPESYYEKVKGLEKRFIMISRNFFERGRYLSKEAKWLYVTLKSFENNETKQIFPNQETIQEVGGLSKNAVTQATKELEYFGWIERFKTRGRATHYKLKVPTHPMEKFEETIYPIPSKESVAKWRKTQRSIKGENGKTFAEKFDEKKPAVDDSKKQKVSQFSTFENDYGEFEINY